MPGPNAASELIGPKRGGADVGHRSAPHHPVLLPSVGPSQTPHVPRPARPSQASPPVRGPRPRRLPGRRRRDPLHLRAGRQHAAPHQDRNRRHIRGHHLARRSGRSASPLSTTAPTPRPPPCPALRKKPRAGASPLSSHSPPAGVIPATPTGGRSTSRWNGRERLSDLRSRTHNLPFTTPRPEAHMRASEHSLDLAEGPWPRLDGKPAARHLVTGRQQRCLSAGSLPRLIMCTWPSAPGLALAPRLRLLATRRGNGKPVTNECISVPWPRGCRKPADADRAVNIPARKMSRHYSTFAVMRRRRPRPAERCGFLLGSVHQGEPADISQR